MKAVWRRIFRGIAKLAAAVIIILALLLGTARLLLPEVASFADDVRAAARAASGLEADFEHISAGVSVHGPELRLYQVVLAWPDGQPIGRLREIRIAIDPLTLLRTRRLLPSRIFVDGTDLALESTSDGQILVQGRPWADYLPADRDPAAPWPTLLLSVRNTGVTYADDAQSIAVAVESLDADINAARLKLEARLLPEQRFGRRIAVTGRLPRALFDRSMELAAPADWSISLQAQDLRVSRWLALLRIDGHGIVDGDVSVEADMVFSGMRPLQIDATADVTRLALVPEGRPAAVYDRLAGALSWKSGPAGWRAKARRLQVQRAGRAWPVTTMELAYTDSNRRQTLTANADFMRLEDLLPILHVAVPQQLEQIGLTGTPVGDAEAINAEVLLQERSVVDYTVQASFSRLGYTSVTPDFAVAGITGQLSANAAGGTLQLESSDTRLRLEDSFEQELRVDAVDGIAVWRRSPDGVRVIINDMRLRAPDLEGQVSLELFTDLAFETPFIDLQAYAVVPDLTVVPGYLPRAIPERVRRWLDTALETGRVPDARFVLRGPLRKFPFRDGDGVFRIQADFEDARFNYDPNWPAVESASGQLVFEQASLYSVSNSLVLAGIELSDVAARIADLQQGVVEIEAQAETDLPRLKRFLDATPVGLKLGSVFADTGVSGAAAAEMSLTLPVRSMSDWRLGGRLRTNNGAFWLDGLQPRISKLRGVATIRNTAITMESARAEVLGEAVTVSVLPAQSGTADFSHQATMEGEFAPAAVLAALGLGDIPWLSGRTNLQLRALFPGPDTPADRGFRLELASDLQGFASRWPYPLDKPAATAEALQLQAVFPESDRIRLQATLQRGLGATLELERGADGWQPVRGRVSRGAEQPVLPAASGIHIDGLLDRFNLGEWLAAVAPLTDSISATRADPMPAWPRYFRAADLQVAQLTVLGYDFRDVDLQVDIVRAASDIRIAGPAVEGRLRVPHDFGADPLEFDMTRLYLLETATQESDDDDESPDPRRLPALLGQVGDFALGTWPLGQLDVDIRQTEAGLRTEKLVATSPSFELQLSGDWQVVDTAQRSRLRAELSSRDFAATLQQLGYSPLIEAQSAAIRADLLWEGAPGIAAMMASTGRLDLQLRRGRVKQLESGGGRILGLLSIATLPRRLALDFSDIADKALEFDRISGRFRLDFGDAWTCDLALEGNVADLVIVGRTGLAVQDYDQVAAVRPHMSNLVPVPAAFLGGPTVGVAALLVTQLFRKPLSSIGETYYKIGGTWSDPEFVVTPRSEVDTAAYADCENQLPNLSPEELAAFEELLTGPNKLVEPALPTTPN